MGGERDGAVVAGLGRALEPVAVVGLVDARGAGGEVDVGPRERAGLSGACADVGGERDEGPVAGGELGEEALDLDAG